MTAQARSRGAIGPRLGAGPMGDAAPGRALLGLIVMGNALSPFFLTPKNFSNLVAALMEVAIMALPLTMIIILGRDRPVGRVDGGPGQRSAGFMWRPAFRWSSRSRSCCSSAPRAAYLNGLLVARGGLPSLVVTLGTLALFRGMALIVLGPRGVSNFPESFTQLGFGDVPGTVIPWSFVIFLGSALVLGIVLHRTWIGRQIYAIGRNAETARYSGVR